MRRLLAAAALVVLCAPVARAGSLTAAEKRGRKIYLGGASTATAIVSGSAEVPASAMPCGSCHGADGRGVAEGNIEPADVRWTALGQPRLTGRIRPRYDDALIRRAVTEGLDAGGNRLAAVMPRYRMHDGDLADLAAYLHRLGVLAEPGVGASEVVITAAVPLSGAHARVGEITRDVLTAAFDDVNAGGGIYGRTLRLHTVDSAANEPLDAGAVFAAVCASGAIADPDERLPLITPFPSVSADASSFFLYPDLETEALALARTVDAGPRSVYVVSDRTAAATAAAAAVERYGASMQWSVRRFAAMTARQSDDDVLFLLGRADLAGIVKRLDEMAWHPRILVAGSAPPSGLQRKIVVAMPAMPPDAEGLRELEALAQRHHLPREQMAAQVATYASAKVLIEGLRRAGRELTREGLIAALESLYQFPTGLTQPITFSRDRHIGADAAYVVALDGR